jgi:hypothetical protein
MKAFIVAVFLAIIIIFNLTACGKAQADDITIQIINAPDGLRCYVIVQGGKAVGGNCK